MLWCAQSDSLFLSLFSFSLSQATEWVYDLVQQEEGEVQERWLLLEEEERRQDHAGGSHEVESSGSGGKRETERYRHCSLHAAQCHRHAPHTQRHLG